MPSDHKTPGQDHKPGVPAARQTPNADMQPEDTGTPASGAEGGRATAAQAAMKQTSKTPHETGSGSGKDGGAP